MKGVISLRSLDNKKDSFSKIIDRSGVVQPTKGTLMMDISNDLEELRISFQSVGTDSSGSMWLKVVDVATIALLVRRAAAKGVSVRIDWPRRYRGTPSRIQKLLAGLEFYELFNSKTRSIEINDWVSRVDIRGYDDIGGGFRNYVPLKWFSKSEFRTDGSGHPYMLRASLSERTANELSGLLVSRGFIHQASVRAFSSLIFSELAWNAVLHSESEVMTGYGVFGGQVTQGSRENRLHTMLSFCICDGGIGIPTSLENAFKKDDDTGNLDLNSPLKACNKLLEYAFRKYSTCKDRHASEEDRLAGRGLYLVSESLRNRGLLSIRSGGSRIELKPESSEISKFLGRSAAAGGGVSRFAMIGTQIEVAILQYEETNLGVARALSSSTMPAYECICACTPRGLNEEVLTAEKLVNSSKASKRSTGLVIVDLGFAETHKELNNLIRKTARQFADQVVLYLNVSTPFEILESLHCDLQSSETRYGAIILCRDADNCCLIGTGSLGESRLAAKSEATRMWLSRFSETGHTSESKRNPPGLVMDLSDYLTISGAANVKYLEKSFNEWDTSNGCYTGKIHLLGADRAKPRFFSLAQHLKNNAHNLQRWLACCNAAVRLLLSDYPADRRRLILVGFAAPLRRVMAEIALQDVNSGIRCYTLLTFDVPSREELAINFRQGDKVVLIADVVSSGTTADAVVNSIENIGVDVVGIISCVAGRFTKKHDDLSVFNSAAGRKRLIVISDISDIALPDSQLSLQDREYWVDPVSLIPAERPVWGWTQALDKRVEETLNLLLRRGVVKCGHVVDGNRHTSVHVNIAKLLANDAEGLIYERVKSEVNRRLKGVGWNNFSPKSLVFPSGISRIEKHSSAKEQGSAISVHDSGVEMFLDLLRRQWPMVEAYQITRSFDPGGNARVSSDFDSDLSIGNDVLVVDDGIWRGTTSRELVKLVANRGARRVLIVTLLCRTGMKDLTHYESERVLRLSECSEGTQVCYCFPLVLPVPYTTANESPYEVTRKRLRDRVRANPELENVVDRLLDELEGKHPGDVGARSAGFISMWVRARTMAELASENESALETLQLIISDSKSDDSVGALLKLFLEEWQILGRGRLKQSVGAPLKRLAINALRDPKRSSEIRTDALALIRSMFPADFPAVLESCANEINDVKDIGFYERLALNLVTLPSASFARVKLSLVLRRICDNVSVSSMESRDRSSEEFKRWYLALSQLRVIRLGLRSKAHEIISETARVSEIANDLLNILIDDETIHDARSIVDIIARADERLRGNFDPDQFTKLLDRWSEKYEKYVQDAIVSRMGRIADVLTRTESLDGQWVETDRLFQSARPAETVELGAVWNLGRFSAGIQILQSKFAKDAMIRRLVQTAKSLSETMLGKESRLEIVLSSLKAIKVRDVKRIVEDRIASMFAPGGPVPRFIVPDFGVVDLNRAIFAPEILIERAIENILDNISRYAFKDWKDTMKSPMITLALEGVRGKDPELVSIMISNNGWPLAKSLTLGIGGSALREDLTLFGGDFFAPVSSDELDFSVSQRLIVDTW